MTSHQPEVWLRGPVPGIGAFLQPVAQSLLQCREEASSALAGMTNVQLHHRPAGAASVAYHIQHAIGSLDRLFTYAEGRPLGPDQLEALAAEPASNDAPVTAGELLAAFDAAVARALARLRAVPADDLLRHRDVGRAKLPSTTIGLLFHAAEHTQRHLGQALTTATVARVIGS